MGGRVTYVLPDIFGDSINSADGDFDLLPPLREAYNPDEAREWPRARIQVADIQRLLKQRGPKRQ